MQFFCQYKFDKHKILYYYVKRSVINNAKKNKKHNRIYQG